MNRERKPKEIIFTFVLANVFGTLWAWMVWIVIGAQWLTLAYFLSFLLAFTTNPALFYIRGRITTIGKKQNINAVKDMLDPRIKQWAGLRF